MTLAHGAGAGMNHPFMVTLATSLADVGIATVQDHIRCWRQQTKKSFGIFGVTIQDVSPALKELLQQATFIFTRETASVEVLRKNGLEGTHITFAP